MSSNPEYQEHSVGVEELLEFVSHGSGWLPFCEGSPSWHVLCAQVDYQREAGTCVFLMAGMIALSSSSLKKTAKPVTVGQLLILF